MVEFDKKAPGGGVSAECRLENGKMFLEWRIALSQIDFRGIIRLKLVFIFSCPISQTAKHTH